MEGRELIRGIQPLRSFSEMRRETLPLARRDIFSAGNAGDDLIRSRYPDILSLSLSLSLPLNF